MTRWARWVMAVLAAAALGGCTQNTRPLNFSLPDVSPAQVRQNAELKTVSMSTAVPGEAAGKIAALTDITVPAWKVALEDAIDRSAIFLDDSPRKLSLVVKITQFDAPTVGFDKNTTATARYEVIDRATRATLFISDVTSTGHVPAGFAFAGAERSWESINRAIRSNIQQFLQQLGSADLSKPVFPPGAAPPAAAKPSS